MMNDLSTIETTGHLSGLLASLLSDEAFRPSKPHTLDETGFSVSLLNR